MYIYIFFFNSFTTYKMPTVPKQYLLIQHGDFLVVNAVCGQHQLGIPVNCMYLLIETQSHITTPL